MLLRSWQKACCDSSIASGDWILDTAKIAQNLHPKALRFSAKHGSLVLTHEIARFFTDQSDQRERVDVIRAAARIWLAALPPATENS
jgi:hypothetical protein